jgi:diguanylate cyclase (GGDEF)-like protein/PAS domain S-box-containing protein
MDQDQRSELGLVAVLSGLGARIHTGLRLADTLDAVAGAVVEYIGFGVAAVNMREPDGSFKVVAVAGSESASQQLLGTTIAKEMMFAELMHSEEWGSLWFIPHERSPVALPHTWVPDIEISDDPDAWHPMDQLFAPLSTPTGELVGLLSVDLPADGRVPGLVQRELLEALAVQAGVAIASAKLTEELHAEREQLRLEHQRLAASEAAFRFSFDGSETGMALISLTKAELGRFQRANEAFGRIFGFPAADLTRHPIEALVNRQDVMELRHQLEAASAGELKNFRMQSRFARADDEEVWVSLTATVIDPGDEQSRFLMLHAADVTERRRREADLEFQAGHDSLTGLPNRRLLLQRLEDAVIRARRHGRRTTVLFCDLDGLKLVNDHYGHLVGDAVLQETAARLVEQTRTRDTVARLGGDEFVILVEDLDEEDADRLCIRIRASFDMPLDATGVPLGISIGRETITATSPDSLGVLRLADEAMYRTKRAG